MKNVRNITDRNRDEILRDVARAPQGWRVSIDEPKRTSEQNRLMWDLLQDFADQVEHHGRWYPASVWKAVMLKAFGKELEFVPSLDGEEIVAIGYSSSQLSKSEMSDFIEFLYAQGAGRGVMFHGGEQ